MKKIVSLLVAAILLMGCTAMAELSVVKASYLPVEAYNDSYYAYFFAEVTNTGDENISLDDSNYTMLDAEGNAVASCSLYSCYPHVLAPGATGYIYNWDSLDDISSVDDIPGFSYNIFGGAAYGDAPSYITVAGTSCEVAVNKWDENVCTVTVTVKNETDATVYDPNVVYGLYDQNGELMYAGSNTMYYMGLPAGQSVESVFTIDESIVKAWEESEKVPTTVNGFAYVEY
jgi:hypothetical protein